LRPLTYTTPKQLLPIVEVPMLERVLGHLSVHGIDEAVLSLGYRPEAFIRAYPDQIVAGVRVSYAVEPERMDTAGAIRFAAVHAGIDDTFLVLNGDVLTDGDVTALIAFHSRSQAATTIYLSPVEDPSRFGVVPTDEDGRVIEFVEKPPPGTAPTNLINAGIYVMEPEVIDRIPDGRAVSVERETFPALAADGALFAMTDGAYWLDTGTPEAYLCAQSDLLEGRRGFPPATGAVRTGAVRTGATPGTTDGSTPGATGNPGPWILGSPIIEGLVDKDSLVGDGARIHSGASVVGSVVGAGCVVEDGAQVTRSVLLPGSRIRSGAKVDLSIVGPRAVVGAACGLSELSIIGDDVVLEEGSQLAAGRVPEHAPNLS